MNIRPTTPQKKVLIVEDSAPVRIMLEHIIGADSRLVVAAAVESGEEALRVLHRVSPDVISMDIRLPGINGMETTKRIMAERPTPIVVISASVEAEDLKISMNALRAGALAVLEKPVGASHGDYQSAAAHICTQLFIMSQVKVVRQRVSLRRNDTNPETVAPTGKHHLRGSATVPDDCRILGIAASTGGPSALVKVLEGLGADFPYPIAVVQHITASFLDGFVAWLDGLLPLAVVRAEDGMIPEPGRVHVAGPNRHLVVRRGRFRLVDSPPVSSQRPSATPLFESIAGEYRELGIGVVLTGMGDDGATGLKDMRDAGGYTLAEDKSTAVVYGMPKVAVELGAACEVLSLEAIAPRLLELACIQSPSK